MLLCRRVLCAVREGLVSQTQGAVRVEERIQNSTLVSAGPQTQQRDLTISSPNPHPTELQGLENLTVFLNCKQNIFKRFMSQILLYNQLTPQYVNLPSNF